MWNDRYNTADYVYGESPNDFLARHCSRIPKGKVLCLAEGEGRNAVFLARQGYQVTAVDASDVGLNKAQKLADKHGVNIHCVHADLANYELGDNQWEGIVAIFCHLPPEIRQRVHGQIHGALKRGGVFLLEAYTPRQLKFGTGGPGNIAMLMDKRALQSELEGLEFEHLQELERDVVEGTFHTGRAAVIQAIAVNPQRRYQVSSHRGGAVHKVRYVESGGGDSDPNCRICQPTMKPREE